MNKAKKNSKDSGKAGFDHFVDVTKMVPIGSFPETHTRAAVDFVFVLEK